MCVRLTRGLEIWMTFSNRFREHLAGNMDPQATDDVEDYGVLPRHPRNAERS